MCFLVFGPMYFKTYSFFRNTAIAPAMKNAGIRHVITWADRYSVIASIPAKNKSVFQKILVSGVIYNHFFISSISGILPEAFTVPSITTAGVVMTP